MECKIQIKLEFITSISDAIKQRDSNKKTVWTICDAGDGEYIEQKIASANSIGFLILPLYLNDDDNYAIQCLV